MLSKQKAATTLAGTPQDNVPGGISSYNTVSLALACKSHPTIVFMGKFCELEHRRA
jgi:hypothetical protein